MKKFALLLLSLVLALPTAAQKTTFEGLELEGSTDDFIAALEEMDFVREAEDDGDPMLTGSVMDYDECVVIVHAADSVVFAVTAGIMECESWEEVEENYFDLREQLEREYGAPADAAEYFEDLPDDADDDTKFEALLARQGELAAWFSSENGYVTLQVEVPDTDEPESCFITLYFCNENNAELAADDPADPDEEPADDADED